MNKKAISEHVLSEYKQANNLLKIVDIVPGGSKQNELIMFLKPEVFLNKTDKQIKTILDMVFDKLDEFEVEIDGAALLSGAVLEQNGIMDRHYGFINLMSRGASKSVNSEDRSQLLSKLNLDLEADYPVLGGHEFLEQVEKLLPEELDSLWAQSQSTKIKSGFYARKFDFNNKDYILVNGFHPQQLAHYTNPDRRILVMLVKSDTDWEKLRNNMVGNTFPELAMKGSIRRTAYDNAHKMGFDMVTVANNVVHLSAGPTESLFEINNFFKPTMGLDISNYQPRLVHRLVNEVGMPLSDVLEILDNPYIELSDIKGDLNGLLEHKNLDEAVELWARYKGVVKR